jgi:hypothetical protein
VPKYERKNHATSARATTQKKIAVARPREVARKVLMPSMPTLAGDDDDDLRE